MNKLNLIDVNGVYGEGGVCHPKYPTIEDYLCRMESLNLQKSLLYHVASKDLNPSWGNRKIIKELKEKREYQERIFPVFVLSPAMRYRDGEIDFIVEMFEKKQTKCLLLLPKSLRYPVKTIYPCLEEVKTFRPIVLVDVRELDGNPGYSELSMLSENFPQMTFILRKAMWWQITNVIHIMKKCSNILADISMFHFRGGIKLFVDQFGEDRLVFGIAADSHKRAAEAALVYADISNEARKKISSGTISKLLQESNGDKRLSGSDTHNNNKGTIWNSFIKKSFNEFDLSIIDAHSHLGPPARGWHVRTTEISRQIDELKKDLKKFNIKKMLSCCQLALYSNSIMGNKILQNEIIKNGMSGKIDGYFAFNPIYAGKIDENLLDSFFKYGNFIGFKILSEYWDVSPKDRRYEQMWDYAHRYRLPVLIHTWENTYGEVDTFIDELGKYMNSFILLGHSGGGDKGRLQAEAAAKRYDNVYLEWCGSFTAERMWEKTVAEIDDSKIVFGTDTFFHEIAWELGRLVSIDVPDEKKRKILGHNMNMILKKNRIKP